MTAPELGFSTVNGTRLAWHEWRRALRGRGPTVLMVHATGFHARVWDQVVAGLPDCHLISLDLRGHGRSDTTAIAGWHQFGDDVAAVMADLGLTRVIGVGHSMGAHALVQATALDPGRLARLVLVDPSILVPDTYRGFVVDPNRSHPVSGRTSRFASVQAMVDRFARRAPYARFTPAALRDYCQHGLVPAPDGDGLVLACAPATEAQIYLSTRDSDAIFGWIAQVNQPVLVVRGKQPTPDRDPFDYSFSPTWPALAGAFADGRDCFLPQESHFLPMENPALMASLIRDEIDRARPA